MQKCHPVKAPPEFQSPVGSRDSKLMAQESGDFAQLKSENFAKLSSLCGADQIRTIYRTKKGGGISASPYISSSFTINS